MASDCSRELIAEPLEAMGRQSIYSLEEFGLGYSEIRAALAPLFEEFRWPSPEGIVRDSPVPAV